MNAVKKASKNAKKLNQEDVIVGPKDVDHHGQIGCPPQDGELWSMHPRVYMPVKLDKKSTCPYCGAVYVYKD